MSRPGFTFLPGEEVVAIGSRVIRLTKREAEALELLNREAGKLVTRERLEAEVWKLGPHVRSEAVPVTLRRLRAKLGEGGSSLLESVRGRGWRLNVAPRQAPRIGIPTELSPFFARPAELAELREVFDAGWRVVTVVGAPGVGKTRVAAELGRGIEPLCFVSVDSCSTAADIRRRILAATGLQEGGETLVRHLEATGTVLFIDAADACIEAVAVIVGELNTARFLVTSRQELGRPDEAVVEVPPLRGEEGVRFLKRALRASRWGGRPDEATLARAVDVLDGLPLAMELAAAHPGPLDDFVDSIERGELPRGRGARQLAETLERSVARLEPGLLHTLLAMTCVRGTVSEAVLASWLGESAIEGVRELASRSLVTGDARAWRAIRLSRALGQGSEQVEQARRSWAAWLAESSRGWVRRLMEDPAATGDAMGPQIEDLIGVLPDLAEPDLRAAMWALVLYFRVRGPVEACRSAVAGALEAHPGVLWLEALAVRFGLRPSTVLDAALSDSDPWTRFVASEVASLVSAQRIDVPALRALSARLEEPYAAWAALLGSIAAAPAAVELEAIAERLESPVLQVKAQRALARAWHGGGDARRARAALEKELAIAERHGLAVTVVDANLGLANLLAHQDAGSGVAAFLETAEAARTSGCDDRRPLAMAGLYLYALGRHDEARPLLRCGIDPSCGEEITSLCRGLSWVIEAREGRSGAVARLSAVRASDFPLRHPDRTLAGGAVAALLHAEADAVRDSGPPTLPGLAPGALHLIRLLYAEFRARVFRD